MMMKGFAMATSVVKPSIRGKGLRGSQERRKEKATTARTLRAAGGWQGRLMEIGGSVLRVTRSYYVEEERAAAEKLKEELVLLGPTFIKLGQAIACRPDLFGSQVSESLSDLHDNCETFSSREAAHVLREELGEDLLQTFLETEQGGMFWESQPCASASLGQVYRARVILNRGTKTKPVDVAVKVQRCVSDWLRTKIHLTNINKQHHH
jgi:predicted unusual protein kinase regulating ubiquinone biosynthesis (AarF/ABC1/UbiB family)